VGRCLSGIKQSLGKVPDAASPLAVVESTIASPGANEDEFQRWCKSLAALQSMLLARNDALSLAQAKSLAAAEGDYCRHMLDASATQERRSAEIGRPAASHIRNTREIDRDALLLFFRKSFPQDNALRIEKLDYISGGFSKFTVAIEVSGNETLPKHLVMRADASATFGGVSVLDEYRLIRILHERGVAVPRPIALEASGTVFGSPFMVVEKKAGSVIGHMFVTPPASPAICRDVAAQLAKLHSVPLAAFGSDVAGASSRSSEKMLAWLDEGERAWRPLNMPSAVFETAFAWLRRNAHLNDQMSRALVHGDYGLNNILIDGDRVSTILDWEFAHIGNPAYDLGYFHCMAEPLASWELFLDAYKNAGMRLPDEQQLNYQILFATTRLGVMVCQTAAEFTASDAPSLAGAAVLGGGYYDVTISRMSRALEKVL
jgi:aminoglycoside phosphotransferase (APT) family kinase protein